MYESKASLMGAFPMSPFDTDKHILEHGTTLRCFIFNLILTPFLEHLLAQMLFFCLIANIFYA